MKVREFRMLGGIEMRAEGDGDKTVVRGYAAVFDSPSEPIGWDGFTELVKPGAFRKTIAEADVRALWNHNPEVVLGRTKAGTLRLTEDERGLAVEIDWPEWAGAQLEQIRRRDVSQMSFGFRTVKDRFLTTEDGKTVRELIEVELFDVSPVTYPAYPETEVFVRSQLGQYHGSGVALTSGKIYANDPAVTEPNATKEQPVSQKDTGLDTLRAQLALEEIRT
jgi:HK97 family phage prohead protease